MSPAAAPAPEHSPEETQAADLSSFALGRIAGAIADVPRASARVSARRRDLLCHLAPLLPLVLLLLALDRTALDSVVSGWFFDPATGVFPLRYSEFLEVFAHHYAKELVIAVACAMIALLLLSFVLPELKARRRSLLFLSLALAIAPTTVALLKLGSYRHCPWDLAEFGGFAPHLALLDAVPGWLAAGHCFPAGHASTGFCLMAFYFVLRSSPARRHAGTALGAGIAAGLLLGLGRIAQGAHFLSHVLWSGVVCWFVIVILQYLILREVR